MLCCTRSRYDPEDEEASVKREKQRIHRQIEKELKADKERRQGEHRILLLGCGEAGKSTFIKQMRIIHSEGFSDEERKAIKTDIAMNVLSAIQTLLQNTSGTWSDFSVEEDARIVESLRLSTPPEELVQHVARIKCLWETSEIQQAYENRNSFQLAESTWYFLSKVEAIFQDDYLPTNQDIVQTRVKTTGIIEHEFEISDGDGRKRKLIMIDVGGQRSERRKWIHCFQDVLLIMFLTAVSEYDQVLAEDEATNRLQESLLLFRTILRYRWFSMTTVILFLNKIDLLKEKLCLGNTSLGTFFPDYKGSPNDYDCALEFFSQKFEDLNPNPKERKLFIHQTCATDTNNIEVVDTLVQGIILEDILKNTMIN